MNKDLKNVWMKRISFFVFVLQCGATFSSIERILLALFCFVDNIPIFWIK